jgi:hypothetical protein
LYRRFHQGDADGRVDLAPSTARLNEYDARH